MPDGGLRDRLIHESLYKNIEAFLTSIGWFGAGREHQPIIMVDEFPDTDGEVALNTLAVSMGDGGGILHEMGSQLEDHEIVFFVDFFAENDSLGRHLRGDIDDYLKSNPIQAVYDYTQGGDPQFTTVEVDEDSIDKRKPDRAVHKWQKHWYVLSFSAVDYARPHTA